MKINKVTITGSDNNTEITELKELSRTYPFVEWGILFSRAREGNNRYPGTDWISELVAETGDQNMSLSAHLCGAYAREFMEGDGRTIGVLGDYFKRFQINFNFASSNSFALQKVEHNIALFSKSEFIFQANKSNASVIATQLTKFTPRNIAFLYDSSGGRGTEITSIQPPFAGYYTGYAGGLNPENIDTFCQMITHDEHEETVWLDVESGVRTATNEFDLTKVAAFLKLCAKYI